MTMQKNVYSISGFSGLKKQISGLRQFSGISALSGLSGLKYIFSVTDMAFRLSGL